MNTKISHIILGVKRSPNSGESTHPPQRVQRLRYFFLSHMEEEQMQQGITKTEEWTDEKHSMYIKSIEASFVNQLYDSKQTRPSFSRRGNSNEPTSTSGQFKVHRGGCWQKINFEREDPQMSKVNQHLDITTNPWIQHYRSSSKQRSAIAPRQVVDSGQKKEISSKSKQFHMCESHAYHQDVISNDTEMSDQNFADEEVKGKKKNNTGNMKRKKSLIIDAKDNDQMVPISKYSSIGDVTKNRV